MHTFIPRDHWAYAGDDNITIYPYDPDAGRALLDEAGWTLAEGAAFRTNADGDELALQFTTTSAAFRQTWAAIWEQQMADCGVRIVRSACPCLVVVRRYHRYCPPRLRTRRVRLGWSS
jgi:ABC-type transport system substrate-binding protein